MKALLHFRYRKERERREGKKRERKKEEERWEREKEEGTEGREDSQPWELRMSKSNLSPHILSTVLTEEEFVSLLTTPKDI